MKFLLLSFLLVTTAVTYGQKKKEVKEANKLFKQGEYTEAMPLFKKFINMDPTNVDYIYKYGGCAVMVTEHTDEALKYLLKAEELGKKDEEIAFFIGVGYEKKEEYQKAIDYFERFSAVASKDEVKNLKVKKRIKSCKKLLKSQK